MLHERLLKTLAKGLGGDRPASATRSVLRRRPTCRMSCILRGHLWSADAETCLISSLLSLTTLVVQVEQSAQGVCVCVRACVWTITSELNNLRPKYLACCFTLTLFGQFQRLRSCDKVQDHRRKTTAEQLLRWRSLAEKQIWIENCK